MRRSPLALLLATVAAGAFPGPAEAISRSGADLIATRVLGLKHQHRPHAVWRWPSPVSARTVITEPGPGHLEAQATRVVISAQGTALVTPLTRRRIGRRVWLYWEDLLPAAMFPHPSTLLLLDARSGRVVRRVSLAWWPLLNGGSPFVRGVRAGPAAPRVRSARRSYAGATAASPGPAGSRVIEIGDFQAPDTAPNFAAWSQYALTTTGKDALRAHSRAELAAAIASAYRDGARDVQIYANGHQFVPIGFLDLLGRGQNWINRTIAGGGWGPSISLSSTPGLGHTWKQAVLTAADLRGVILQAKQQFPGLTVSVVVETCGAGNFGPSLEGAADRYITSVTSGKFSMAPPRDGSAPSPFSGAAINAVRSVIPRDRGASLTDAIGSVEPTIANDTTAAAMQRDGGTYPQEPTYDRQVSGRIIQCPALYAYVPDDDPRHCSRPTGKVVVRVSLGFSLDAKSSGTVMISPAAITVSSSSPPPSFGNPALGDVFFYAAPNTEVKLTANHGANSYFDGWQVHNGGRCMPPTATPSDMIGGGSPGSCTLIARDRGDGRAAVDGFAFFLTCPPPGTHFARHGAAIDCPGVTEGR